jgi:hypothetical protein
MKTPKLQSGNILKPNKLLSSAQTRCWHAPVNVTSKLIHTPELCKDWNKEEYSRNNIKHYLHNHKIVISITKT